MEKYLNIPVTNISTLVNKEANFIPQPYTNKTILIRHFNYDLQNFIEKLALQFNLPTFIFNE
jgi:hypothetical protein